MADGGFVPHGSPLPCFNRERPTQGDTPGFGKNSHGLWGFLGGETPLITAYVKGVFALDLLTSLKLQNDLGCVCLSGAPRPRRSAASW